MKDLTPLVPLDDPLTSYSLHSASKALRSLSIKKRW